MWIQEDADDEETFCTASGISFEAGKCYLLSLDHKTHQLLVTLCFDD